MFGHDDTEQCAPDLTMLAVHRPTGHRFGCLGLTPKPAPSMYEAYSQSEAKRLALA